MKIDKFTTMYPIRMTPVNNSTPVNKNIAENKKYTPNRKNLMIYLTAIGTIAAAGIYIYKNKSSGKIKSTTTAIDNLEQSQTISKYVQEITKGLEMITGKKINPKNLSCIMNKTDFINAVSKLTKENYIANPKNIEDGIFKADLHSHSIHSDGQGTISDIMDQVCAYANILNKKTGDKFIFALTDHDTAESTIEALKLIADKPEKFKNVRFVIGSEVSYLLKSDKTSNPCETSELLVYCFNPFSNKVKSFFDNLLEKRILARQNYIKDLSAKFPETHFSEKEFTEIFLGNKYPHKPMMNSFWHVYHYGQIKKVLSDTAKANNKNPEIYFKECMEKAPKKLNLEEFKRHNIIENWISENNEIKILNEKYRPEINSEGIIIPKSENLIDDIIQGFKDEEDCIMGFAHPYYISERINDVPNFVDKVISKLGNKLKLTESYHQAYSSELLNKESKKIDEISNFCESRSLIPIGGRDNHLEDFIDEEYLF